MAPKRTNNQKLQAVVVNDDVTQLNELSGLLEKAGLEVQVYASAGKALEEFIRCEPPDLIVTDLYMPVIDGWRFCRLLRSPEYKPFNLVPILVVSATFSGEETKRITADLGANAFLPVPVDARRFIEQVRAMLAGVLPQDPLHALIVEANKTLAGVLKKRFEAHGYRADTARTAKEALEAFKHTAYDVAVLDDHLPDGLGDSLLKEFNESRSECVCIMMTTDPGPKLALDWMTRGAAAFLKKPFEPQYLLELCTKARRERAFLHTEDLLEARRRQLRESENLHRTILQTAMDGFFILDMQWHLMDVNAAYCRMSGYSEQELLAMSLSDLEASETADDIAARAKKIKAQGEDRFETRHRRKDGSIFDVEVSVQYLPADSGRIVAFLRDITKRKRAEAALRESEEKFAKVFNDAPVWIAITDIADGTYLDVNEQALRVTGFFREEVIGHTAVEIGWIRSEDRARLLQEIRDHGRINDVEMAFHAKDGRLLQGLVAGERIAIGGRSCLLTVTVDITERKLAEKALQHSEELYRMIAEASADLIWRFDLNGNLAYVSPVVEKIFGYSPHEAMGLPYGAFISDSEIERADRTFAQCLSGSEPHLLEFIGKRKDGSLVPIEASITPVFQNGIVVAVQGFGRDITERKRAEQERERLTKAIEQVGEVVVITDTEGTIQYVNPAFEKVTGYTREEAVGKNPRILKSGEQEDDFYRNLWGTLQRGEMWSGQFVNKKKDGTLYTEEALICPVSDTSGRTVNYVAAKRDITEQIKLKTQVQQAQKMEAIGTLAGGIAHDFNNILSVIIGNCELLIVKDKISESSRESVKQILAASQRAKQLIGQILAFSRQGGQQKILINLKPVIKETIGFLRASLPATIQLKHYIKQDAGAIIADPTQMQQILMNLCTNAAQAMEERGGVLRIELDTATASEEDNCLAPGAEAGKYVKLTVSDKGQGMEPWVQERIFDPYFTTKRPGKGTGLGLSVVHGIVKSHGGMIKVYSEAGKGTTFNVFLPSADGVEEPQPKMAPNLPRGTEKILFVDDETGLTDLAKRMLGFLGYQVDVRTSPIEALELFRTNPERFDAVVTDMTMPQMTGLNLSREILAIRPGTPIILCTGFSEQGFEEKAYAVGIRAFLFKPPLMADFANELRRVLDEK